MAFDEHGAPSFERLQQRMNLTSGSEIRRPARAVPVTYMIFDLLYLDGQLTAALPYRERRELLEALELNGPAWQTPANHLGSGREFLAVTAEHHLEGVVAKRLDSPYLPGARSRNWLKIKNSARQELVIGGWLPGKGRRAQQIGALLMGYYERRGRAARAALRRPRRDGLRRRASSRCSAGSWRHGSADESPFSRSARSRRATPASWIPSSWPRSSSATGRANACCASPSTRACAPTGRRRTCALSCPPSRARRRSSRLRGDRAGSRRQAGRKPVAPRARARAAKAQDARKASARASGSGRRRADERPYRVLRESADGAEIEVQGRTLRLTNRDKVMYPASGFTKGQLVDYYAAVAPVLLGHLAAGR